MDKGHYIGLEINGISKNFVAFRPRRANVIMDFKLPDQGEEMKVKRELIRQAWELYGKP